jgi:Tfp pilus assembly protein PilX
MIRNRRNQRGSALLTALAVVAMTSMILAGVGLFVASHAARQRHDADYALALQLAEAGINYEFRFVSSCLIDPTGATAVTCKDSSGNYIKAHTPTAKGTGTIAGVSKGSFEVWVVDATTGGAWSPPSKMTVIAEGLVNDGTGTRIRRRIQVTGERVSIFEDFSVFGINNVSIGGSDSLVVGTLGTDGALTSSSTGSAAITEDVLLAGPNASGPTGNNVFRQSDPVLWPTIDQIINFTFPGTGWSWLTTTSPLNRANTKMRQYASTSPALTPSGTVSANWPSTGAQAVTLKGADFGSLRQGPDGMSTIILPPGDYYFTDISMSGNNKIIIDNAGYTVRCADGTTPCPGQVRIWMNGSTSNDTVNVTVEYTSNDKRLFRLYYNKCADFKIAGNSTYSGGFYAVRSGCTSSFTISGGSLINGAIIATSVNISGGSVVNYPMPGTLDDVNDYALWYGFRENWREATSTSGAKVFSDGTDN